MERHDPIFVAGHRGLLGSALVRRLHEAGFTRVLTRTHRELDLGEPAAVGAFFQQTRPAAVILAAARVGGIVANQSFPAEFMTDNLRIESAVIPAAHRAGVGRLIFFGSNCAYPLSCPQPMREEWIGTGALEPTSLSYALAKLAGMTMCDAYNRQYGTCYLSLIPATLYGPGDNFDPQTSHVLSGLLRRVDQARLAGSPSVTVWGSGRVQREFLYVDELAEACMTLLDVSADRLRALTADTRSVMNAGSGEEVSTWALAALVKDVVGFEGQLILDPSQPDGAMRKCLDSHRIQQLGWSARIPLREGLRRTYAWYKEHAAGAHEVAHAR